MDLWILRQVMGEAFLFLTACSNFISIATSHKFYEVVKICIQLTDTRVSQLHNSQLSGWKGIDV